MNEANHDLQTQYITHNQAAVDGFTNWNS